MKNTLAYTLIAFSFILMVTGCYTEKRASKQTVKAYVTYPDLISGQCGLWFDPVVMTKDSFIYKQGEIIYKKGAPQYVYVDCDSVQNPSKSSKIVKIPCPPCDSVRVDTLYRSRESTEANRAKEHAQAAEIKVLAQDNTKLQTQLRIAIYALIALAAYTLGRWVLRIWGVKLP